MPAANAYLLDQSVAHQAALIAFANEVSRQAQRTLSAADDELMAYLARTVRELLRLTPTAQREARVALSRTLAEINAAMFEDVEAAVLGSMAGLIAAEERFQSAMLAAALGAALVVELTADQREGVLSRPYMGRTITEQAADTAAARLKRMEVAIATGLATDAPLAEVLQQVEDALPQAGQHLDAIAQTDTAGVAQEVSHVVYDVAGVEREWWVSVLDSRTTEVCMANDGATRVVGSRTWSNGYSGDYPAHWGERSVVVPLVEREPPAKVEYEEWLRGQSEATQRQALGEQRFKLWRDGRLPLGSFTNDKGRTLTLDELREMEPGAFARAGA